MIKKEKRTENDRRGEKRAKRSKEEGRGREKERTGVEP